MGVTHRESIQPDTINLNSRNIWQGNGESIFAFIQEAARERIDLYTFTSEVAAGITYDAKISIIEHLFRVACVDGDLDNNELEAIRRVCDLFNVSHRDFIDAKIRVKKEFGMDTAGY